MPTRTFSASTYRYGFQGQEKENDIVGEGLAYKYRIHDARIGKFLSTDPLSDKYPHNSPYAFSENRVIDGVELEGLEFAKKTGSSGEVIQGSEGGYDYVGFNEDGSPKDGSVPGAFYYYKNSEGQNRTRVYYVTGGVEDVQHWSTDFPGLKVSFDRVHSYEDDNGKIKEEIYEMATGIGGFSVSSRPRAPWVSHMYNKYLGVVETVGSATTPEIEHMIKYSNRCGSITNDNGPWCGVAVSTGLGETGYPFSVSDNYWYGSALAKYWKYAWPESVVLDNPVYGAVAVRGESHVGFVVGQVGDKILLMGGNQRITAGTNAPGRAFNLQWVPLSSFTSFRIPSSYKVPKSDKKLGGWSYSYGTGGGIGLGGADNTR